MQRIIDILYVLLLIYLFLYSILTTLYDHHGRHPTLEKPDSYGIDNIVTTPITCAFPVSSQYQKVSRYLCYILLCFTVIIRKQKWLAAGAAAWVMTYSGVLAIHLIILFATNNRFNMPEAKLRCEQVSIPGTSEPFFACAGVWDPDTYVALVILGCVILGALPMSALSTTFRNSTQKVILLLWLVLLAIGHTFDHLTWGDSNRHFQVCRKDNVEPLPGFGFQAPLLDQSWSDSFQSLVRSAQQASQSFQNSSKPACLYSCFASSSYIGRTSQNIGVFELRTSKGPVEKNSGMDRRNTQAFWWLYSLLALLTFFVTEKEACFPRWMHKRVAELEYHQKIWTLTIKRKHVLKNVVTGSIIAKTGLLQTKKTYTIFTLIQFFTQTFSVLIYGGAVVMLELQNTAVSKQQEVESFANVGQWSAMAAVLLVLVAAMTRRIGINKAKGSSAGKSSIDDLGDHWNDGETVDMRGKDWNHGIGYAS